MIRPRRKFEFVVVAIFLLCAWYLFDVHFKGLLERIAGGSVAEKLWRYEATEPEEQRTTAEPGIGHE